MDTKKLRQKILDLAIRGKLVPQDPNDEPASVLLERIRTEKERLIKEGKIKRSKKSAASDTHHYENEMPFEVPESWEWTSVESFTYDLQYGTSEKSSSEGDVPVLRMGNITRIGTVDFTDLVYSSNKDDIEKFALVKNDLLFNRTNSSEWVGKTAIFKSDSPAIYAGYLIRVRCILVCPDYVNFVLNSSYHRDWCNHVKTDAVNQSNINAQKLSKHLIPIPPYEEQLRIVAGTNKWMSVIDKMEDNVSDFEHVISKAKFKILDLAIHGKLVPQDPNDEPAIDLLKRINPKFTPCDNAHYENVPFEIPKSWRWTCMAEVNEYNSASVDPSKSPDIDFELYSVPAYETGMPEFVKGKDISSSKKVVTRNDVLLCKINPHLNRAWIVSHYKENIPCLASSEWIIFRNSAICPQYLSFCFTSNYFKELMLSNVSGVGGSLMRAQPAIVNKYLFPMPPIDEQCRIVAAIQEYYEILDSIIANL